ncbi:MAG: matrixin family metalloprotease [ANME-2 cluster archaeon]|jgi:predicted Zn-dependent protease|nr:MAG: matrixin family metalloprotease [ANME-2 cluster archaeon]
MNTYHCNGYSDGKRQSVAAHEFGHALGIDHRSGEYLMEPDSDDRWDTYEINEPTNDEINAVQDTY